jgi:hypothetical protein
MSTANGLKQPFKKNLTIPKNAAEQEQFAYIAGEYANVTTTLELSFFWEVGKIIT